MKKRKPLKTNHFKLEEMPDQAFDAYLSLCYNNEDFREMSKSLRVDNSITKIPFFDNEILASCYIKKITSKIYSYFFTTISLDDRVIFMKEYNDMDVNIEDSKSLLDEIGVNLESGKLKKICLDEDTYNNLSHHKDFLQSLENNKKKIDNFFSYVVNDCYRDIEIKMRVN